MGNPMRHAAVLLAAVIMILLSATVYATAEEGSGISDDGLIYEVKTDAATGEKYAVIADCLYIVPDLVIPAEIGGFPVREVAAGFTARRIGWDTGLETLTVEEGIASIGESAFANCTSLRQVSLPQSLIHVGVMAFANIGTEGLNFPQNVNEAATDFIYCSVIRKDRTDTWEYGLLGDGTAVITGYHIVSDELIIPETVDGIPVTEVARVPLEKIDYTPLRRIKSVTLPESLKTVGHLAFEYCGSLIEVKLPAGVTSIGYGAFRNCQALACVELPQGLKRIGDAAFSSCPKLEMPKLPDALEEIGNLAFYGCSRFNTISLSESVRSIGDQAFSDCKTKKLTLNESLATIGYKAFYGNKLTDVGIPASVEYIGDGAFQPADGGFLRSVTVSGFRTKFGKGVFGYDDGWRAFYLEHRDELNIASTLFDKDDLSNWHDYYADPAYFSQKTLSLSCYSGSTADLMYKYYVEKTILKGNTDSITTAPSGRLLQAGLYQPDDQITELIIPEGVEEIGDRALAGLGTLTRITLPSTLVRIGAYAFDHCVGLTEIVLPESLREIGEGAFRECWELAKANMPENITEIRDSVFENCKKLKSVNMPKTWTITRIGNSAFAGCEAMTVLKMDKGLEEIGESAFAGCGLKEAKIPDTVVSIGKKAFARSDLTKLKLPAGMEEVPEGLCEFSTKLVSLQFPKTLKRIGKNAFRWCGLKSLTLPEGLLSIGECAFGLDAERTLANYRESKGKRKLSELKSVSFPASLTVIERNAFAGCDSLSAITFPKKSMLTEIGEDAFAMCVRLNKFTAPDSLQKIGKGAFRMCMKMAEANLGKGVTEVQDEAFFGCIGMKKLTVPECLTVIGQDVLKNYGSKLKVTCTEGSTMQAYMAANYPSVPLVIQKKK